MNQVTDMIIGLDAHGKTHVQVFFEQGTNSTAWQSGWCVVGQPPDFALGVYFTSPQQPVAQIQEKDMIKMVVTSILNEGGYEADTYIGKPIIEGPPPNQIMAGQPHIQQWVSITPEIQTFFQTVLQWCA